MCSSDLNNLFSSAVISCIYGARTNGQYPTGILTFSTSSTLNAAPTEKMRIDSSGNVGIGTTSPAQLLEINKGASGGGSLDIAQFTAQDTTGTNATNPRVILSGRNTAGSFNIGAVQGVNTVANGGALVFQTTPTSGSLTERMRIDSSGNVGIGTSSPTNLLDLYNATSAVINVQGDSSTAIFASRYGTNTAAPVLGMQKYRGSYGSPSIVSSGDNTGRVIFYGYDGTNALPTAEIRSYVDGTPGTGDMPGRLSFWTTADGASSATERARIDSSGNVLVTNPAGLGYGTGSGGTVTQATSKSTTVVLNKPTGQITMNGAALASGAVVLDRKSTRLNSSH